MSLAKTPLLVLETKAQRGTNLLSSNMHMKEVQMKPSAGRYNTQ